MEEGVIPDGTTKMKSKWGTKITFMGLENKHEVITFRCKSCGYLESYAK